MSEHDDQWHETLRQNLATWEAEIRNLVLHRRATERLLRVADKRALKGSNRFTDPRHQQEFASATAWDLRQRLARLDNEIEDRETLIEVTKEEFGGPSRRKAVKPEETA